MWRVIRRIIAAIAILMVVVPVALTLVISSTWFKPKLNNICSSFIEDGQIIMDSISVSLLEELPYLNIKLYNGALHSYAYFDVDSTHYHHLEDIPYQAHTPLSFKEFTVSLNIPQLLLGKIDIRRIRMIEPNIYAYISPWGKGNWDIFSEEKDDESEYDLNLSLKRLALLNGSATLHDGANKSQYQANIGRMFTRGNITLDPDELEINRLRLTRSDFSLNTKKGGNWVKVNIDSLNITEEKAGDIYNIDLASRTNLSMGKKVYTKGFPLNICGTVGFDLSYPTSFDIDSTSISIAGSPILFDGKLNFLEEKIFTNIHCAISEFNVGKLISYLDKEAFPQFEGMSTNLKLSLDAQAVGRFESQSGLLPAISARIKIPNGNFQYPGIDMKVENIGLDALLSYDPYIIDSTSVNINYIDIDATGITLKGKGSATNLINDPYFDLGFSGSVDLTKLSGLFLKGSSMIAQGDLSLTLDGKFKGRDISLETIGNTQIYGELETNNLLVDIPQDSIYTKLENVKFCAQGSENIGASFEADSADITYKDIAQVSISKARASIKSAAENLSNDTTAIHPLAGNIGAQRLRVKLSDSTRIYASALSARASMYPSQKDSLTPVYLFSTSAKRLGYRDSENILSIRDANIRFNGKRRETDTTANVISVDEDNIDMSVDEEIGSLLDKWDATCRIKAGSGLIITPYLPLKNTLGKINLTLNTDMIRIDDTEVRLGDSDLALSGNIWGVRDAVRRNGKLKADLLITSDTLEINQLLQGINGASNYLASKESIKEAISELETEEEVADLVSKNIDTTQVAPLIIPGNIDIKLGLFIGYGEFSNITMNGISGTLYAKDKVMQLNNLKAITDAGELSLNALYSSRKRDDLNTGFDLELRNIQLDRFIEMAPALDTLAPILQSVEGILNCEVAATAKIGTNMNVILPSLNGAARIKGEELVLLDEETFAKIAKMLKFKNRDRNIIDQLTVEMLIQDNKVEMFPFLFQMDRIMAAASGVHELDMNFNYHISVIKSPLPIRLGVNLFGSLDDFDFKLTKPRYKNSDIPSFSNVIDESKLTLRKSIVEVFNNTNSDITDLEVVQRDNKIENALRIEETEELSEEEKSLIEAQEPSPAHQ